MNVHIVLDANGRILSVHRTTDGLAHFLAGHGDAPQIEGSDGFSIESLADAFTRNAVVKVVFTAGEQVSIERHAVLV